MIWKRQRDLSSSWPGHGLVMVWMLQTGSAFFQLASKRPFEHRGRVGGFWNTLLCR